MWTHSTRSVSNGRNVEEEKFKILDEWIGHCWEVGKAYSVGYNGGEFYVRDVKSGDNEKLFKIDSCTKLELLKNKLQLSAIIRLKLLSIMFFTAKQIVYP